MYRSYHMYSTFRKYRTKTFFRMNFCLTKRACPVLGLGKKAGLVQMWTQNLWNQDETCMHKECLLYIPTELCMWDVLRSSWCGGVHTAERKSYQG